MRVYAWVREQIDHEAMADSVGVMSRSLGKVMRRFTTDGLAFPVKVAKGLQLRLEKLATQIPVVACLCNPGMKARHWGMMKEASGLDIDLTDYTTLRQLTQTHTNLLKFADKLEEISDGASKEYAMEQAMDRMMSEWEPMELHLSPWRDTGTYVLKGGPAEEAQVGGARTYAYGEAVLLIYICFFASHPCQWWHQ